MKREFLGWTRPPLHSAVDWLMQKYAREGVWNLSNVIVVLPAKSACRRLLELIAIRADADQLVLSPPLIETLGNLPEQLYQPRLAFASELTQVQAWMEALRGAPKEILQQVAPHPPGPNEQGAWRSLAKLIQATHRELASDHVTFHDAAEAARKLKQQEEAERWLALDAIARRYYDRLDALQLWDRQTARLVALDKKEYRTEKDLVVIAAVDLNKTQRHILDQVADATTILIAAPPEEQHGFDEHGALKADYWCESNINLPEESIQIVSKPVDQAYAAAASAAQLAKNFSASEMVIGVVDDALAPHLESAFGEAGVPVRLAAGKPLTRSSPFLLLRAISDWLSEPSSRTLAALVRHPQVFAWINSQDQARLSGAASNGSEKKAAGPDLLERLDQCITDRLIDEIPRPLKHPERLGVVAWIAAKVDALLKELHGKKRPFGEWADPLSKLFSALAAADPPQGEAEVAVWRAFAEACGEAWAQWETLNPSLAQPASAEDAIDLLCDALEGKSAVAPTPPEALDLSGWLDLPLDDRPAAVITGFNEGRVPSAVHGDVFLPNTLRVALNLTDNRRRLARDAYALRLLAETKEALTFIAGRLDGEGNPLSPSRLLFFMTPEETAERLRRMYAKRSDEVRVLPAIAAGVKLAERSQFRVPEVRRDRIETGFPKAMRVTTFRDFLACGYRYYLKEIEKLRALRDEAEELPPNRFGDLLHAVLSDFGKSEAAHEKRVDRIEAYLLDRLHLAAEQMVGPMKHPAFSVQLEQLKLRLQAFARWQADWRAKGWRIAHSEAEVGGKEDGAARAWLRVDDSDVELLGRIDRIDFNDDLGQAVIFDYKTGDEARAPEKAHLTGAKSKGGQRWKDLQLPLYQILAASLGVRDEPQLGYIVIPKKSDECGQRIAQWGRDVIDDALETARDVVRRIRRLEFELASPPPRFSEDFAPICQDRTLRNCFEDEEESE